MRAAISEDDLAARLVEIEIHLKAVSPASKRQMPLDFPALNAIVKQSLLAVHGHGHLTFAGGVLEGNLLSESLVQGTNGTPFGPIRPPR